MFSSNSGRIAAVVGQQAKTYADLDRDIGLAVHWLQARWMPSWSQVGLRVRHRYWHWVLILALFRMGKAVASVVQARHSQAALPFDVWLSCRDSGDPQGMDGVPVLHVPASLLESMAADAVDVLDGAADQATPLAALRWVLHPQAQRLILTSGTTGRPKVVRIPAADLDTRVAVALRQYEGALDASTRMLTLLGVDTLGGFFVTLSTWMKGGTVLFGVPSPTGPGDTQVPYLASTVLSVSPAGLRELLDRSDRQWPGHANRQLRLGGSRLHRRVRDEALQKIGARAFSTYGATELGLVASCDAQYLDQAEGMAGKVFADVKVEVVDAQGVPLPFGQPGRIRCRAPGMATHYDAEPTSPEFADGWFYPGDLGVLSESGWLVIEGRADDVLNLGGVKVSAVDIETALLHAGGLRDVCVVALDQDGAVQVVAAVVLEEGADLERLGAVVAGKLPRGVRFVMARHPSLPRNAMGKLQRPAIAERLRLALQEKRYAP